MAVFLSAVFLKKRYKFAEGKCKEIELGMLNKITKNGAETHHMKSSMGKQKSNS
jgi:hypothetical protein